MREFELLEAEIPLHHGLILTNVQKTSFCKASAFPIFALNEC